MKAVHTLVLVLVSLISLTGCSDNSQSAANPAPEKPSVPTVSAEESARTDALEAYRFVRYLVTTPAKTPTQLDQTLKSDLVGTLEEAVESAAEAEVVMYSCYSYIDRMYSTPSIVSAYASVLFGHLGYPLPKKAYTADEEVHEHTSSRRPKSAKELYDFIVSFPHDSAKLAGTMPETTNPTRGELAAGKRTHGEPIPDSVYLEQCEADLCLRLERAGASEKEVPRLARWYIERMQKLATAQ
jgi:hypothetical protein